MTDSVQFISRSTGQYRSVHSGLGLWWHYHDWSLTLGGSIVGDLLLLFLQHFKDQQQII
jgi:hypothetical protein